MESMHSSFTSLQLCISIHFVMCGLYYQCSPLETIPHLLSNSQVSEMCYLRYSTSPPHYTVHSKKFYISKTAPCHMVHDYGVCAWLTRCHNSAPYIPSLMSVCALSHRPSSLRFSVSCCFVALENQKAYHMHTTQQIRGQLVTMYKGHVLSWCHNWHLAM